MATNITIVLFIVVMDIAVLYFHYSGRCSLILEIVTVKAKYVYLINDVIELIINPVLSHCDDHNDIRLFTFLGGPLATWPLYIFAWVLELFSLFSAQYLSRTFRRQPRLLFLQSVRNFAKLRVADRL